jgi:predicted nuclease of predicted toxin-antitoxin system
MKLKLDENLPAEAATVLATAGHDVATVLAEKLGGHADPKLAAACKAEGRALITLDTDFANIRRYPPREHSGLVVLRLTRQDTRHVLAVLSRLIEKFDHELLPGHLWIVEEHRMRIRPGDQ